MASWEEFQGRIFQILYKLRRMKEEHPQIHAELEVLEENVEVDPIRFGWALEQDGVADCDEEEEAKTCKEEDVAGVSIIEE